MKPLTFYGYVFAVSAAAAHAAFYYPAMPFTMAVHFGPNGQPDLWSSRESYFLLMLVMLALNIVAFGVGPRLAAARRFRKLGIPNKDYWMATDRVDGFYRFLQNKMAWFGIANVCFLAFVNQMVFNANTSPAFLEGNRFVLGLAGYFVFVIIWFFTLFRKLSHKE